MPFEIVRNDITNMRVDAIVNSANPAPTVGWGVDTGVHRKAGPRLLAARLKIGRLRAGEAVITPGFDLPAKYVIHTVGPKWQGGGHNEEKLLRSCYTRSLSLAKKHRCQSVAFPLISAGNYGFPPSLALQIAMDTIREFLMKQEMRVYLVVFDRESFRLSEKRFQGITSFIDENYIRAQSFRQYGLAEEAPIADAEREKLLRERMRSRRAMEDTGRLDLFENAPMPTAAMPAPKCFSLPEAATNLTELLAQTDAGFSETLLSLIDRTGKKDSEIYTKANVSRQHFSKIRNNPDYKPTKSTAIAFAIALELNLEDTRDLIGRAGYALTNSSKFDVIIMYFIREGNYNLFDINAALFEFDQSLLGM